VKKEMSEIDEYFKDEFKKVTSFTLTPMYIQCLKKLSTKIYVEDQGYIATTLRRIMVEEGLNIMKNRQIDSKIWKETQRVGNTDVVVVKINDKIKKLILEVALIHFTSRSHFARYTILKNFYRYFPEEEIGKAKVVSLGKLF
jgi:hypothetical protein